MLLKTRFRTPNLVEAQWIASQLLAWGYTFRLTVVDDGEEYKFTGILPEVALSHMKAIGSQCNETVIDLYTRPEHKDWEWK